MIGYDESEMLEVESARYFVAVTRREKRACRACPEAGVTAAPLPARILEKSLVCDRIVLDTLIGKYLNHFPLYRQSLMLGREARVEITRATMDEWVIQVGELLLPLVGAMRGELLAAEAISRPMKLRWLCKCTMAGERIIKPIYGNTANRDRRRYSISG